MKSKRSKQILTEDQIDKIKKLLEDYTIADTARILDIPYSQLYRYITRHDLDIHHRDIRGRYINPTHTTGKLTKEKLKNYLEKYTVVQISAETGYSRYWIYLMIDKYDLEVKVRSKRGRKKISKYSDESENYPFKANELQEMLKTKTTNELAIEYGLDSTELRQYVNYHKLKIYISSKSKYRPETIQKVLNKNTITDTARILNTSAVTIHRYIYKYKLKTPYKYNRSNRRNRDLWKKIIVNFYKEKVTISEYAVRHNVSRRRMTEMFNKFGYYYPKKSPLYCTTDIQDLLYEYTVNEIEEITGIPRRTIHSYIHKYNLTNPIINNAKA